MTKEEFEKLKADEMRAALAERNIKVAAKATKAVMVEAFVAATTSAGQVESPTLVLSEEVTREVNPVTAFGPLNVADAIVVTEAAAVQNAPAWPTPQPSPAPEPQPRAPLNRKQRRRLAALNEKRADRKMRALDLRG